MRWWADSLSPSCGAQGGMGGQAVKGRAREPTDLSRCLSEQGKRALLSGGVAHIPPLCIVDLCARKICLYLRSGCSVLCQPEM